MADMMKSMGGAKRGGALAKMAQALGLAGRRHGACRQPTPEQIAAMQKQFGTMPGAAGPRQSRLRALAAAAGPAPMRRSCRALADLAVRVRPQPGKLPGLGGGGF